MGTTDVVDVEEEATIVPADTEEDESDASREPDVGNDQQAEEGDGAVPSSGDMAGGIDSSDRTEDEDTDGGGVTRPVLGGNDRVAGKGSGGGVAGGDNDSSDGVSTGAIVGVGVACVVLVAIGVMVGKQMAAG